MRFNSWILALAAGALLLAESRPGVPAANVEIRTSNGAVDITGSDTAADQQSVMVGQNEPLTVVVRRQSSLEVATSNGPIRVSGVTGALHLTTSNGQIEVALPPGTNAKISAHTSNGHIRSDIPVNATVSGDNALEGTIGNGGPLIELRTSNANIYIRTEGQQENVTSIFTPGKP